MATYYDVLGVEPTASLDDIRAAHRLRLQLVHPDRHQGSSEAVLEEAARQTRLLNEAFEVLRDERQRAAYDADLRASGDDGAGSAASGVSGLQDFEVAHRRRVVHCPACNYRETALADQRQVICHACRCRYGFAECTRCGTLTAVASVAKVAKCSGCGRTMRTPWAIRR